MRIERIEIDGFGRFHDTSWELPGGLTVLVGANEAGKTTLLNALRALLFGFEANRDGRAWYPALAGGRRGGRLVLRTRADERWVVERHGERGGGGALAVRAPSGNQGGQETLDRLLHGADKDLYNNIFAFGLGELQTFASLSAVDLERRLKTEMEATFLPGGSKRPLNALMGRIEELRGEIAALAHQPEEHADAHRERAQHVEIATAAREEAHVLRERLARLRALRDATPVVAALDALVAELEAGDASLDAVPADAAAVLDRHVAARDQARAVLATIDEGLRDARRERDALAADEAILLVGPELRSALDERPRHHADDERRRDLEAAALRADAALREQVERTGGLTEAALIVLDDSIPAVEETRRHELAISAAAVARADAAVGVRALADELATREEAAVPSGDRPDDGGADLEDRLDAYRELEAIRLERAVPMRIPTLRTDGGLLAALGVVAAGLLLGFQLGAPAVGAALGIVLALLVFVLLRRSDRPEAVGHPNAQRWTSVTRRLGLEADASAAEIAALGQRLAEERARRDLAIAARSRDTARRSELARRERELERAEADLGAVEARWCAWLEERGLPAASSPDAVRHLLSAAGIARRAAAERDAVRAQVDALDAGQAAYAERVDALFVSVGLSTATDRTDRDARLVALGDRLEAAREAQRRAEEIDARIAQLEDRRVPAAEAADAADGQLTEHLRAAGCPDVDAARARLVAADARRALRAEERGLRERLLGIAGGAAATAAMEVEARGANAARLDATAADLSAALAAAEAREREASAAIGALDARISQLEATAELGDRRQELAQLEGRARAMAREWAVRALAHRLLSITRARHERERQPGVIRAAEGHFDRITDGRYARIIAPPGESTVRVETESGESRGMDELSRGTGEQLYLALRFGLIEEFAGQAEPLPVVMDDILVNFDVERASRAAAAIGGLAERHQVLYFTCHPWTAELLDPDGRRTVRLA